MTKQFNPKYDYKTGKFLEDVEYIYQKWFCYAVPKGSFPNLEKNTIYRADESIYQGEGEYKEGLSTIFLTDEEPTDRFWNGIDVYVDENGNFEGIYIPNFSMGLSVHLSGVYKKNVSLSDYKRECRSLCYRRNV